MRLNLDWNSALDSIDRGRDPFREHWDHSLVFQDSIKFLEGLIMYSSSECLVHSSRWIAGLASGSFYPFVILEKNIKFFFLPF